MTGYLPIISIDPKIAHKLDIAIELRKLYYNPQGYYRTAEKLRDACKKAGNHFSLVDVRGWLDKQALLWCARVVKSLYFNTDFLYLKYRSSVFLYRFAVFKIQIFCIKIQLFNVQILKNAEFRLW